MISTGICIMEDLLLEENRKKSKSKLEQTEYVKCITVGQKSISDKVRNNNVIISYLLSQDKCVAVAF